MGSDLKFKALPKLATLAILFSLIPYNARATNSLTGPVSVSVGELRYYTYYNNSLDNESVVEWQTTAGTVKQTWNFEHTVYTAMIYFDQGVTSGNLIVKLDGNTHLTLSITVGPFTPPTPSTTISRNYSCGSTQVHHNTLLIHMPYSWWWQTSSDGQDASNPVNKEAGKTITSTQSLWLRARLDVPPYTWSTGTLSVGSTTVYSSVPGTPSSANHSGRIGEGEVTLSVDAVSGVTTYKWYTSSAGPSSVQGNTGTSYTIPKLSQTTTYYVSSLKDYCESTGRLAVTGTIFTPPQVALTSSNGIAASTNQPVELAVVPEIYTTYTWKNEAGTTVSTSATFSATTAGTYNVTVTKTGATNSPSASFSTINSISGAALSALSFEYKYDDRRRMTQKRVPGAGWVYMVYDNRDRLILTQDSVQRTGSIKYWSFTKYDHLNRPILTGIRDTTASLTQVQMQSVVDEHFADEEDIWSEKFIGSTSGNVHGYSNKAYPIITGAANEVDIEKYLTVTYYDSYDFRSLWIGSYGYADDNLSESANGHTHSQPDAENIHVLGQVTGSKVKVLDGGVTGGYTWLKSVTYYDEKYRVVQTLSDNYKGGTDRTSSVYDFTGKVLETKLTHTENDITWKDLSGATVAGNKLVRTAPSSNAGGASKQILAASTDGWMEFTVTEVSTNKRLGFNDSNPDTSPGNINYSFNLTGTTLTAMENSLTRQTVSGGVKPGDVLRIARVGTAIKWYRNGVDLNVTGYNASNGSQLLVDCTLSSADATTAGVRSSFSANTQTIARRFVYDHGGRLLNTYHKLNSEDEVLLSQNEYNEIGQLVDKKLHSVNNGPFKQSTDMRYNIRGWLTSINNSQLAVNSTNDDTNDLYGMELGYEASIGTGNTGLYNGNISAMKWSRNMALGDVKDVAYNYTYDPMNRLLSASYKKDTIGGWTNTNNSFNESGYAYDLNGNIMSLVRRDAAGVQMDNLTYDYGTGATQSNRLMKVTDSGNDEAGFKDINNSAEDYVYDANGNMVWDRNKGGAELLDNGGFDNGSSGWQVQDTYSRFTFTGGNLNIAAGSSGVMTQNDKVTVNTPYVVIIDITRTSSAGQITVQLGNHSIPVTTTGVYVLSMLSTGGAPDLKLYPTPTWVGTVNSVSLRGLTVIAYNFLNLPEVVTNSAEQMRYIYDATGRKLHQNVYTGTSTPKKATDYAGEFIYQNDTLQFINTEEGRIVMKGTTPEYQYHLKDHLGNVRTTFTTRLETDSFLATYEADSVTHEQPMFNPSYDQAVIVNASLYNHTHSGSKSQRLSAANANEIIGLAKSLSLMPGDTVRMEVWARYNAPTTTDTNVGALMLGAMSGMFGVSASSTGEAAKLYQSLSSLNSLGLLVNDGEDEVPKAYLNYILFDRNYVPYDMGFEQVSSSAAGGHEKLAMDFVTTQASYVYVYISNESDKITDVFFDDLKITHSKSPVVQSDDYYPFGLAFNSYNRENSTPNQNLYQGKELQDELGLEIYDFQARGYDPILGRTWQTDPMSETFYDHSPYSWVKNNPLLRIDPTGMTDFTFNKKSGEVTQVGEANDEPDRILKTNNKGEVKYKKNGEAKVAMGGIEQGILADGQNWKTDDQVIEVGGEGQASVDGVKSFTMGLSEYLGKEMKGFSYSSDASGNVTDMVLGKYLNNSNTESHGSVRELAVKYGVDFSRNNITQEFHTHPDGKLGATQSAPNLSQDVTSLQSGKSYAPNASFIVLYRILGQKKPGEYDYTHEYRPKRK